MLGCCVACSMGESRGGVGGEGQHGVSVRVSDCLSFVVDCNALAGHVWIRIPPPGISFQKHDHYNGCREAAAESFPKLAVGHTRLSRL